MDMIHELAEKIGAVADAIRANELQQDTCVSRIAELQRELQDLMDKNRKFHHGFMQLSDQFVKTYPHVVDAELTGNSLNRVFEPDHDDEAQRAVAEQARPMPVGEVQQVMKKTRDAAKAAAQGAASRPLVPAPDPFRPLGPGEIIGVHVPNPSAETLCNAVLEQRRAEFHPWFSRIIEEVAKDDAQAMLIPVSDGELAYLLDRFMGSTGNRASAMRSAVNSFLSHRSKP